MKTLDEVISNYKFQCADCRDRMRVAKFCTPEQMKKIGIMYMGKDSVYIPLEYTEENIDKMFKADIKFAYDKYKNSKGLIILYMTDVLRMWCWILEIDISLCQDMDELFDFLADIYKIEEIKKNV